MELNWWEIVSAALGLSCVVLAGRNSKYNFYLGYAYNIFLAVLFWSQSLFAAMALQPVSFAINIFGHWRWTHPKSHERSNADPEKLRVSKVSWKGWGCYAGIILSGGAILGSVLSAYTSDPLPWLDSYILMLTFLAQYLSAQKRLECWFVWMAVNAANITLYAVSGLWVMTAVAALYLINGIVSYFNWRTLYNNKC